jgi:hypothetical protein
MPTYNNLEDWIRTENEGQDSVNDQIIVARWFLNRDITVVEDRVARTSQVQERVEHRLEHLVRTSLDNLEEIGVLAQFEPPGSGYYIRHHRSGENFYDPEAREFVPLLEEELSRFLDDLSSRSEERLEMADGGVDDGEPPKTLRGVAADAMDVGATEVESALTDPDESIEQMNRFDSVVKAVKENEKVSRGRDYDEMGWRNSALRWSLSERATHMEENQSLT